MTPKHVSAARRIQNVFRRNLARRQLQLALPHAVTSEDPNVLGDAPLGSARGVPFRDHIEAALAIPEPTPRDPSRPFQPLPSGTDPLELLRAEEEAKAAALEAEERERKMRATVAAAPSAPSGVAAALEQAAAAMAEAGQPSNGNTPTSAPPSMGADLGGQAGASPAASTGEGADPYGAAMAGGGPDRTPLTVFFPSNAPLHTRTVLARRELSQQGASQPGDGEPSIQATATGSTSATERGVSSASGASAKEPTSQCPQSYPITALSVVML